MTDRLLKISRFNLFILLGIVISIGGRRGLEYIPIIYFLLLFFIGVICISMFMFYVDTKKE